MPTVADILLARGRQAAEARRREGESSAQMWQTFGNTIGSALVNYGQQREQMQAQKAKDDEDTRFRALWSGETPPSPEQIFQTIGPERGLKVLDGLKALGDMEAGKVKDARDNAGRLAQGVLALPPSVQQEWWPRIRQSAIAGGLGDEQSIPEQFSPEYVNAVAQWGTGKGPEAPKTREIRTKNPDGSESVQIVEDKPGFSATSAAPKPTMREVVVKGPNGKPIKRLVTEDELAQGVEQYEKPEAGPAPERPSVWVKKGNETRYVTPTDASRLSAEGWTPASTREQGRPVTSGDAGRIAEFKTSLDDLNVLRSTLTETEGATGTSAKVGAMLPNWATELTGWGTDAKKRQGVIDRVKQVIGKALEGGVLRKEDEYKYEKILPTIYDPPEVAKAKLDGLEAALKQRQATFIDSLSDAGYDVTDFASRNGKPRIGERRMIRNQVGEWDGSGWVPVQ